METTKTFLTSRRVIIKPIEENFESKYLKIDKRHVARFRMPGCSYTMCVPMSDEHKSLYPILNNEEQNYFEEIMGKPKGSLSSFRLGTDPQDLANYNYWYGFTITFRGEETILLDLSRPLDYLKYKLCLIRPEIANSYEERLDRKEYKWYMAEENYVIKVTNKSGDLKAEAYDLFNKMKSDAPRMLQILKSLGKIYSTSTDIENLNAAIYDVIETPDNKSNQYTITIKNFIEACKSIETPVKAIIQDALSKNIITKAKGVYSYNGEKVAMNMDELITWISSVEMAETKKIIELQLKK